MNRDACINDIKKFSLRQLLETADDRFDLAKEYARVALETEGGINEVEQLMPISELHVRYKNNTKVGLETKFKILECIRAMQDVEIGARRDAELEDEFECLEEQHDIYVSYVTRALYSLTQRGTDPNTVSLAALHYTAISKQEDVTFEELFTDRGLVNILIIAMRTYAPDESQTYGMLYYDSIVDALVKAAPGYIPRYLATGRYSSSEDGENEEAEVPYFLSEPDGCKY